MKRIILKILVWYKKYFSRGYNCRLIPTCSEYMYQAVEKYGVIKGGILGIKRLSKCGPGEIKIDLLK